MKIDEIFGMSTKSQTLGGYSKPKAGIIPYFEDGTALFFLSSDSKYGGADPSIAKGRIDKGENELEAAIREGREELGLKTSNFKSSPVELWKGEITGLDATYTMTVFAVEVKSKTDFDAYGKETGSVEWLTLDEYKQKGRSSQWKVVKNLKTIFNTKKPGIGSRLLSLLKK